jgi:hypothetical protein
VLVTVPDPPPVFVTTSVRLELNDAVTVLSTVRATTHVPEPLHPPPDHPEKTEPAAAAAVRVIDEPDPNVAEHVAPQLMPAGLLVTDPAPFPVRAIVSVRSTVNVAVTVVSELIVT